MHEIETLIGREVEQVWVWWSLRLVFVLGDQDEPDTYVDLTEFRFTDAEGAVTAINVESDPVGAGPALGVLRRRVTAATVENWELRLSFDNGASIVCPPLHKWEAWAASLGGERLLHCPPGGDPDA